MSDPERDITAIVLRERSRLAKFIRRRIFNAADAEDILQDVFYEFVAVHRLPATIEQASAWLYRVARNRIIDRLRKRRELSVTQTVENPDGDGEYRLDLALPSPDGGPEADYARSVLLTALQRALDELPDNQREVFIAHELAGRSFKALASASGSPINTLLARKRYAVLFLRTRLQTAYEELEL